MQTQAAEVVGNVAQAGSQADAATKGQAGQAAEQPDPMKSAIESLQSFFDTPDQMRGELTSGAEDGLSR